MTKISPAKDNPSPNPGQDLLDSTQAGHNASKGKRRWWFHPIIIPITGIIPTPQTIVPSTNHLRVFLDLWQWLTLPLLWNSHIDTHTHKKTFLRWKENSRGYFKDMLVRVGERQRVDTESCLVHFNGNLFTAWILLDLEIWRKHSMFVSFMMKQGLVSSFVTVRKSITISVFFSSHYLTHKEA